MACKIHFRRFVALLLCCLLALYTPLLPIAHASDPVTAATLAVTGGQIASGGLTGEAAVAALGGPVGAVVGLTLGALGIGVYVSKASADAGVTPTEFIVTSIGKYCVLANIKKEQFYKTVIGGLSVAADGAIALSNSASQAIQQFGSWLVTQGSDTIVPEIPVADSYVQFGDFKFYPISSSSYPITGYYNTSYYTGGVSPFQFFSVPANTSFLFLSSGREFVVLVPGNVSFPGNGYGYAYRSGSSELAFSLNFGSYTRDLVHDKDGNLFTIALASLPAAFSLYSSPSGVYSIPYTQFRNELNGKTHSTIVDNPSTDVFTGTPEAWAENKDVLNPSAEDDTPAAVLNPDLLNPIIQQLAEGSQWEMGITDYLKALEAAFDQSITGLNDAVAQLTDVVTGIQDEIAIPDDAVKQVDLTKPEVAPITTPVVQPLDVNPDEAIQGISFQLDEVFPFCLPFDVYKMLSLLSAEPVAPRYHVHYEGPYNIVIDFTVDLSAWDNVALICRNMELLLFCVGLAVVTRSISIGVWG